MMLRVTMTASPIRRMGTSLDGWRESSRRRLIAGVGRVRRARPIDCLGPLVDGFCSDTLSLKQQDAECDEDEGQQPSSGEGFLQEKESNEQHDAHLDCRDQGRLR